MLNLTRTGIRNIATNDFVYSRGLNYYNNHRVINASYSKKTKQYHITVKGNNNYLVVIHEKDNGSFEYTCNCPDKLKHEGACKHVVAALTFLMKYQEKSISKSPMTDEEKTIYNIIDYFEQQEDIYTTGEIFHIDVAITIPSMYHKNDRHAFMTMKAGTNKLYKVQSIKKFLLDYKSNQNIVLGKDFKFIAGESEFDRDSSKIINFLLDILDVQEFLEDTASKNIFMKSQMMLSATMLFRLLHTLNDNPFTLNLYGRTFVDIRFKKGNPKLHYSIDVEEDGSINLDCREADSVIPIMESGDLLYCRGFVYQPDKRFIQTYLPFYNSLSKSKKMLSFSGANKERFLEYVLPKIHNTLTVNVPEELKDIYIYEELKCCLYLDKYHNDIKAELKFRYGAYEFNAYESGAKDGYIILRQKEREEEMIRKLEQMDFEPHKNYFLLKDESKIYELLTGRIDELSEICELYYSEDFKKINLSSSGKFRTNLRLSSDLNLLEFDLENDTIPKDELYDLFKSFRLKKKYYRLKNGDFINLDSEQMQEMSDMLEHLNVSMKELKEETN